ncbi:MAG: serine/threonine-protein kinase [Scytonema sp. PMC 1069.18]|nr:serine/threonine-protein kinase [Scytonema sp. PMC 1069.18]MEC4882393.1 serine/threonine-protein kinase [Scytonema sp. PMC 1070.18]
MLPEINPGTFVNNRYQIQKLLGQGGFGRTYLVSDTQRFGDRCVLKEFVPANTKESLLCKARELFTREAKVLYQINHPQIPKFLAFFTENERLFIVQEYIDGQTYAELLSKRLSQEKKPFSEVEVLRWLLDILPVLDYLHQQNIIHRDIALDNIMLPRNYSQPVLIDFGVVKQKVSQLFSEDFNPGSVVGKVGYSPIEQISVGLCYPCSDLYALGVCAVVLLSGKMPDMLRDSLTLQWQWHSYVKVSHKFNRILEKMLAEDFRERYQSAAEILYELQSNGLTGNMGISLPYKEIQTQHNTTENLEFAKTRQPEEVRESQTETLIYLNPEFLENCQKKLATFVGPIASVLVKKTLLKYPQITPQELVEKLAESIPHPQKYQEFKNSIKIPLKSELKTATFQSQISSSKKVDSYSATSNSEFLQHCRQELVSSAGPFASFILDDTLAQNPQITPEELVEALAAKIPHNQRAQEFRKRIKLPGK